MTITELIKRACKTKGVDEKYAERIEKTFKVDKAESVESSVDAFKENVLPAITEAETAAAKGIEDAKKAAEAAAVAEYEKRHGLKDGEKIEKKEDDPLAGKVSPEIKAILDAQNKQLEEMKKALEGQTKAAENASKLASAKALLAAAKLPEAWADRIKVDSETPLADQIKVLGEEYTQIQQAAIIQAVANGDYHPGGGNLPERSVEEWAKVMDGEETTGNRPGVVDLGINK